MSKNSSNFKNTQQVLCKESILLTRNLIWGVCEELNFFLTSTHSDLRFKVVQTLTFFSVVGWLCWLFVSLVLLRDKISFAVVVEAYLLFSQRLY